VAGQLIVDSGKGDASVIQRFHGYIYELFRSCEKVQVRELDGTSIKAQLDLELRFGRRVCGGLVRFRLHEVLSKTVAETLQAGCLVFDGPRGFEQ
jgi:hypothetical protein